MFIYKENKQVRAELKKLVIDNDLTLKDIAERCDITPQQLNNRFNNSRLSLSDLAEWANCIGYDLQIDFVPKTKETE